MSTCKTIVCSFLVLIVFLALGSTPTAADEVKRISVNGYELAYVEQGQGEPVIFVHGGLQDYRMWSEQLPKFATHYRAIAYSRRNSYPNAVSPEGTPDSAADLHGVRSRRLRPRTRFLQGQGRGAFVRRTRSAFLRRDTPGYARSGCALSSFAVRSAFLRRRASPQATRARYAPEPVIQCHPIGAEPLVWAPQTRPVRASVRAPRHQRRPT